MDGEWSDLAGGQATESEIQSVWSPLLVRLGAFYPLKMETEAGLRRILGRPLQVSAHADLLKHAERRDSVLVLAAGFACRYRLLENGRRQITGILVPGDICDFGFLSGNSNGPRIMSLVPCLAGRMAAPQLIGLCENHPELMRAVLRAAAMSHASTQESVISLGARTAFERVGHLLCEMRLRLATVGLVDDGKSFDFPLKQAEIGETLGLSTVHVNRTLQTLRKRGLLSMALGRVTLHDPDLLAKACGFNPDYLHTKGEAGELRSLRGGFGAALGQPH